MNFGFTTIVAAVTIFSSVTVVLAQEAPKSTEAPAAPASIIAPESSKSAAADAPASAAAAEPAKSAAPKRAASKSAGPSRSVGARTAACKLDCSAGNLHGGYRTYGAIDPQLKSPESRKLYAECVRLCLDPLPGTYAQKTFIENGSSWFGKTKADCLGCHAEGKPKRWWPGVNTLPDNLRR